MGAAELTRATELFSRSAERYEESYGAVDPRTIAALYNLALAQSSQGRADQAIVTYKSVLSRSLQGLGPHHPQTASVEFNLAQLLAAAGESEDAIALLEAATEAYEQVTPADSSEFGSRSVGVASASFMTGVFINSPFDDAYQASHDAIVLTVVSFGMEPRSALETGTTAKPRMRRIFEALEQSDFSIHDLSRPFGDPSHDNLARFNMPFEFGMAYQLAEMSAARGATTTGCV